MKYTIAIVIVMMGCAGKASEESGTCGENIGKYAVWKAPIDATPECVEATSLLNEKVSGLNIYGSSDCDKHRTQIDKNACTAHYEGDCSGVVIVMDCDVTFSDADCEVHVTSDSYDCVLGLKLK